MIEAAARMYEVLETFLGKLPTHCGGVRSSLSGGGDDNCGQVWQAAKRVVVGFVVKNGQASRKAAVTIAERFWQACKEVAVRMWEDLDIVPVV